MLVYTRLFALDHPDNGAVAYGAVQPDGRAVVQWLGPQPTLVLWQTRQDTNPTPGAGNSTVRWLPVGSDEAATARSLILQNVAEHEDLFEDPVLEDALRQVVRALRHRRPIDFQGRPIPDLLQRVIAEELGPATT